MNTTDLEKVAESMVEDARRFGLEAEGYNDNTAAYNRGKAQGLCYAAFLLRIYIAEAEKRTNAELEDQAREYERSEKDCMWEDRP